MSLLPTDIENIIHKMKVSMIVHENNKMINNLQRKCKKADDIFIYDKQIFWNNDHEVYFITTNKEYKIHTVHMDYQTRRDFGFHWTYVCNKCGEILKLEDDDQQLYSCNCHLYIHSF